jgi:hypothetical protein
LITNGYIILWRLEQKSAQQEASPRGTMEVALFTLNFFGAGAGRRRKVRLGLYNNKCQ